VSGFVVKSAEDGVAAEARSDSDSPTDQPKYTKSRRGQPVLPSPPVKDETEAWYNQQWQLVEGYSPNIVKDYTFMNKLTDLCELYVNRSGCWEGVSTHIERNSYPTLNKISFQSQKSQYQQSIILDTAKQYGKQLFLDCMPQSSEADEFIYHEVRLKS